MVPAMMAVANTGPLAPWISPSVPDCAKVPISDRSDSCMPVDLHCKSLGCGKHATLWHARVEEMRCMQLRLVKECCGKDGREFPTDESHDSFRQKERRLRNRHPGCHRLVAHINHRRRPGFRVHMRQRVPY